MAIPERVKTKMKEEGLQGVNKPKRTPSHPKKSHCVMAKEGDTYKFIRFGQQGVSGAGKTPLVLKIRHVRRVIMLDIMLKANPPLSYQLNTGHIR